LKLGFGRRLEATVGEKSPLHSSSERTNVK
jgi:hypothetical protein